jgi:hypothetical protein
MEIERGDEEQTERVRRQARALIEYKDKDFFPLCFSLRALRLIFGTDFGWVIEF